MYRDSVTDFSDNLVRRGETKMKGLLILRACLSLDLIFESGLSNHSACTCKACNSTKS
jgi:hypothetical protein